MLVFMNHRPDIARNPLLAILHRGLNVTKEHHGERFLVRLPHPKTGKSTWFVTPLLLALLLIEAADMVFAVDSIPAIFAITADPFVVYTSNVFAVLGLRALYFALAAIIHRFTYLKPALAVVLVFIGSKVFLEDLLGWQKFPAWVSLSVTLAILGAGILYSVLRTRRLSEPLPDGREPAQANSRCSGQLGKETLS
jgi:tellurite resistance protein TerC